MQPDQTTTIIDTIAPPPTFSTLPGVASLNSVYSDHNCVEENGTHHLKLKGEPLNGAEGWGEEHADFLARHGFIDTEEEAV